MEDPVDSLSLSKSVITVRKPFLVSTLLQLCFISYVSTNNQHGKSLCTVVELQKSGIKL